MVLPGAAPISIFLLLACLYSASQLARRRDLRKRRIFTIDPPTARDLDDALSCRKLDDGNFEIGVHIADVT